MELLFDHTFGKQEQQDLVVCKPMAVFEPDEEAEAIEHGWLALDTPVRNREVFYQSRSTRVDLQKFRPRFEQHTWQGRKIGTKIIDASEMVKLLGLPGIYKQYMKRKKFGADYNPFGHYHKRDQFMIFYLGTADNIESCIHANTIPISAITLDLEMIWAADNQVAYYYMGSGYENSSEYKARWRGFQWWDGIRWSTDKQKYRRLCRRDSRINSFSDLGNPSLIEDNS